MYRQGDVLISRIRSIPAAATPVSRDGRSRLILAEGEATGHAHAIDDVLAELFEVRSNGELYLRVGTGGASLRHEEHATLVLPRGTYRVTHQREYTPEAIRRVMD